MRVTIKNLEERCADINEFIGKETFKIGQRNGYVYFDWSDHRSDALFNRANTKRELLMCMNAFYDGLNLVGMGLIKI